MHYRTSKREEYEQLCRGNLPEGTIKNPSRILEELYKDQLSDDRYDLIRFTDFNSWPEELQPKLVEYLFQFLVDNKNYDDKDTVILCSIAARRTLFYLPIENFDKFILDVYTQEITLDLEYSIVASLQKRLVYDAEFRSRFTRLHRDRVMESLENAWKKQQKAIADNNQLHCKSSSVMIECALILALTNDERIESYLDNIPRDKMTWFIEIIAHRSVEDIVEMSRLEGSPDVFGLLPKFSEKYDRKRDKL